MKFITSVAVLALASGLISPASAYPQGRGRGAVNRATEQEQDTADAPRQMRFRAMDTNNDGVITRDEWRGSDQSFRQHDTNHDGVLSGPEVWIPAGRGDQSADRSRREERAARFERLDTNLDDRVSFTEWTGTRETFDRMDRDGDGFLSRDEFINPAPANTAATTSQAVPRDRQTQTRAYQAGYDRGLTEGRQAGREDKNVNGGHWDLEGQRELEQADSGYLPELGVRADYQAGYRAGFRAGYREGFGPRR